MWALRVPDNLNVSIGAHKKWMETLNFAQRSLQEDKILQAAASKGLRIKDRYLPPEIIGRCYAQYCILINEMYNAYLESEQVQRAKSILLIIPILVKRMFELRNELVHLIVNDYIYVDAALIQFFMTPPEIEIIIPYHLPLESRPQNIEQMLQKMWTDAVKRKQKALKPQMKPVVKHSFSHASRVFSVSHHDMAPGSESDEPSREPSVHTKLSEDFIQASLIQKHERVRQWYLRDFKAKCVFRRLYFASHNVEPRIELKEEAAKLIQRVYRAYMRQKREKLKEISRDILIDVIPDAFKKRLSYREENEKLYERRRNTRQKIEKIYWEEFDREKKRLIYFRRGEQIEDITVQIREWFKDWYYGYGFFPQFPYDVEGGTIAVIRSDYTTVEEQIIDDEKYLAATKGKTKEQLKDQKRQEKEEAAMKAQLQKEKELKEAQALFKARCNPEADPGYQPETSTVTTEIQDALQSYLNGWSIYDRFPPESCKESMYGFLKSLLTEEVMCQMHVECRRYVDELMKLDLKLLVSAHQAQYKRVGWKYPKQRLRPKPKEMPKRKPFEVTDDVLTRVESVFDYNLITKPTVKIEDIYGDLNYGAYEKNVKDPDAGFPPPGYGDIRRRLILSCVLGSGMQEGATRNKSVMLLGPPKNGKSFLVDAVAGEMNAVKIDISPEVFSAKVDKAAKMLTQVMTAARSFQPAVIFLKNVERVFCKKVPPEEKHLCANKLKGTLGKFIKLINTEDKIIFIATCTYPLIAPRKPLVSLFNEIILVPRTDYNSVRKFIYDKLQNIRSMPRDYCVQPLAHCLQGYGFGMIIDAYNSVMTAERIPRLHIDPISPFEFLEVMAEKRYERITKEDYQVYTDFFIENSSLAVERMEYDIINKTRAALYEKMEKKEKEKESKAKSG